MPELAGFHLAGGTSLALQLGHRLSIDLDLFGYSENFNSTELFRKFQQQFAKVEPRHDAGTILQVTINDVMVDIVNYRYPPLEPPLVIDGIRLLSKKDIAAMKISAIGGRGSKKDFIDLYFLVQEYTLAEIVNFAEMKFKDVNLFHAVKSLTYFDDAELLLNPVMLEKVSWDEVKAGLKKAVHKAKL